MWLLHFLINLTLFRYANLSQFQTSNYITISTSTTKSEDNAIMGEKQIFNKIKTIMFCDAEITRELSWVVVFTRVKTDKPTPRMMTQRQSFLPTSFWEQWICSNPDQSETRRWSTERSGFPLERKLISEKLSLPHRVDYEKLCRLIGRFGPYRFTTGRCLKNFKNKNSSRVETGRSLQNLLSNVLTRNRFYPVGPISVSLGWSIETTLWKLSCKIYKRDWRNSEGGTTTTDALNLKESATAIFNQAKLQLHTWHSDEASLETENESVKNEQSYAKTQFGKV